MCISREMGMVRPLLQIEESVGQGAKPDVQGWGDKILKSKNLGIKF
jgi:hypothetical protein